jgi:hypothetical protein
MMVMMRVTQTYRGDANLGQVSGKRIPKLQGSGGTASSSEKDDEQVVRR